MMYLRGQLKGWFSYSHVHTIMHEMYMTMMIHLKGGGAYLLLINLLTCHMYCGVEIRSLFPTTLDTAKYDTIYISMICHNNL